MKLLFTIIVAILIFCILIKLNCLCKASSDFGGAPITLPKDEMTLSRLNDVSRLDQIIPMNYNDKLQKINTAFDNYETHSNVVKHYKNPYEFGLRRGIKFDDGNAKFSTFKDDHTRAFNLFRDKKFNNGYAAMSYSEKHTSF